MLLDLERDLGRTRHGPRLGPRTIDLDILLYDSRIVDEPEFESRIRAWPSAAAPVLEPLAELGTPGLEAAGQGPVRRLSWAVPMIRMSHLSDEPRRVRGRARAPAEEGIHVAGLFRYCVLTQDATYLCNTLDLRYVPQPSYPFFHLRMEDVWVWDKTA